MRQMFDPFERVARAHHICPCCERPFSAQEEDDFVKKVTFLLLERMRYQFHLSFLPKHPYCWIQFSAKSQSCKFCRSYEIVSCGIIRSRIKLPTIGKTSINVRRIQQNLQRINSPCREEFSRAERGAGPKNSSS